MSTGEAGPAWAAAMPSSSAIRESIEPPKTDNASPLERARNERRLRPVPAGTGIPGSIPRRPRPAWAFEKSSQWQAMSSARLVVGAGADELAQGVLALGVQPRRAVRRDRPAREVGERGRAGRGQSWIAPERAGAGDGALWRLGGIGVRAGVGRVALEEDGDRLPAPEHRVRVEPALVVPARDVRRVVDAL